MFVIAGAGIRVASAAPANTRVVSELCVFSSGKSRPAEQRCLMASPAFAAAPDRPVCRGFSEATPDTRTPVLGIRGKAESRPLSRGSACPRLGYKFPPPAGRAFHGVAHLRLKSIQRVAALPEF